MSVVGIDAMIVIYAGIAPATEATKRAGFPELQQRALLLLDELAKRKTPIVLPAVAVAELLVPVPEGDRGSLIAELSERFVCRPFDLLAAAIASSLWEKHKGLPAERQYSGEGSRAVLKADMMIVATAKAAGAIKFYSHDGRCRALADMCKMDPRDLPTPEKRLFE